MLVLVTGGAGYIGSVLVSMLMEEGYEVRVLDNLMYDNGFAVEALRERGSFEFVKGDVTSQEDLERALRGVDVVVHLAALVGAPVSEREPELTWRVNYEATVQLADLCQRFDVDRLLFASTTSVYGSLWDVEIVDESGPFRPVSLYAKSKLKAERHLLAKAREEGLPVCCLRVATNYGPSLRPRFDLVVNRFVCHALRKGSITVYGGRQWRPFVHTHDTARAYLLALKAPLGLIKGEVYNAGSTEENYTISQVAELVKAVLPETQVEVNAERDPRSYRVDFSKIRERLGFRAERTLPDGIRELVEFVKSVPSPEDRRYYNYPPEF